MLKYNILFSNDICFNKQKFNKKNVYFVFIKKNYINYEKRFYYENNNSYNNLKKKNFILTIGLKIQLKFLYHFRQRLYIKNFYELLLLINKKLKEDYSQNVTKKKLMKIPLNFIKVKQNYYLNLKNNC